MIQEEVSRKSLDDQEFLKLRRATEKISDILSKRIKSHLDVLKPLFVPKRLFGSYVKSASMDDVPGSDKAFAKLQERYGALSGEPFNLPRKLQTPLPAISNQLEVTPFQYLLPCGKSKDKTINVTSPIAWVIAYRSECPLTRLKAMISGNEARQPDDIRGSLVAHLAPVIFIEHFQALQQLLEDLRYRISVEELSDLGNLPVVTVKAPLETFLPPDDFILQVTQLSGVPAFEELIDLEQIQNMPDPMRESLLECAQL